MNADKIVREARGLHTDWVVFESMHHGGGQGAKSDDGEAERKFMLWLVDDFPVMCDLIESLQAQLSASQRRYKDAVNDIEELAIIANKHCEYCIDHIGCCHSFATDESGNCLNWGWSGRAYDA